MKDIRILTGKPIIPPPDTVTALFAGTHTAPDVSGNYTRFQKPLCAYRSGKIYCIRIIIILTLFCFAPCSPSEAVSNA